MTETPAYAPYIRRTFTGYTGPPTRSVVSDVERT